MEHDTAHSVVVLLELDEVISSAESTCLIVALLYLRDKLPIGFILSHFSLCTVKYLRCLSCLVVCEACRDISKNIAADSLHKVSAACYCFTEERYRDIGLNICHTAPYINSYRVGNNNVLTGDNSAYGHALACMSVGHKCYPFVCEW